MRAIWKGAVAFGLVNVPVRLYSATGEHEVTLHQVHREDGGRIRYRKFCSIDGEPVEMSDIAKGYETDDGELVVLTDEDFRSLPLSTEREIEVLEFVPVDQVDPILLQKTYYLEPEKTAAKPYALLRGALEQADRVAVVKVALRQRESMAILRVRDNVIVMQTLLWPDEVRAADFPVLDEDVSVRPQELAMAASLVDSLAADFDPSQYEDRYAGALEQLIEAKVVVGRAPARSRCRSARRVRATAGETWSTCWRPCSAASRRRAVPAVRSPSRRGGASRRPRRSRRRRPTRTSRPRARRVARRRERSSADRQADAVAALRRIAFLLERAQASPYRSEAFRGAARSIERQDAGPARPRWPPRGRWPTCRRSGRARRTSSPTCCGASRSSTSTSSSASTRRVARPEGGRAAGAAARRPALAHRGVRREDADPGDGARGPGAGARVPGDHRPLAAAHGGQRAVRVAAARPAGPGQRR